jgi:hypothetical protein
MLDRDNEGQHQNGRSYHDYSLFHRCVPFALVCKEISIANNDAKMESHRESWDSTLPEHGAVRPASVRKLQGDSEIVLPHAISATTPGPKFWMA